MRIIKIRRKQQKDLILRRKEYISSSLINLKLLHKGQILWSILYAELLNNGQVLELAWKDARTVLFMTTIGSGVYI